MKSYPKFRGFLRNGGRIEDSAKPLRVFIYLNICKAFQWSTGKGSPLPENLLTAF